jgi:hypothetical protein
VCWATKVTKVELTLRCQIYIKEKGCYDIQHYDIQHNITQHTGRHTGLVYDAQNNWTFSITMVCIMLSVIMLNVVMLNVVMLSVVMLNVVAPEKMFIRRVPCRWVRRRERRRILPLAPRRVGT